MLTSKKIVSDSRYHVSNRNKIKHETILNAQLDFKEETAPREKSFILHRMSYDKHGTYPLTAHSRTIRNSGDLGDYLANLGLRSIQVNRIQDGDKMVIGYFEDDECNEYYFNSNKRKLRLNVYAVSKNIDNNLEEKINLKGLNKFILTGEMPTSNKQS